MNTEVELPPTFSPEANELLQGLLTTNPLNRLGSGDHGAANIMSTTFFASINFHNLLKREIEPPFKPEVNTIEDTKYIPKALLNEAVEESVLEKIAAEDASKLPKNMSKGDFKEFSYEGDEKNYFG
jgi:hypothetical protein